MTTIACPNCANLLSENGRCDSCGLDGALLLAIRGTARELANEAARRAGAGDWAQAYELAAESLRLMWRDNDLAAFVVLAAAVSGARGPVRSVPRPRLEHLPEALAPHVDEVLATAERLRSGQDVVEPPPAETELEAERETETAPAEAVLPPPPPSWWRSRSAAGLSAAAVAILTVGVFLGAWGAASRETPPAAAPSPASTVPAALTVPAEPAPPQPAPEAQPPALPSIPVAVGQAAWNEGLKASRDENYAKAREHLEIAVLVPPETFYRDDALYYLAKAYHRLGEREKAADAYDRVIGESSDQTLVSEARRLRARLERGDKVDG